MAKREWTQEQRDEASARAKARMAGSNASATAVAEPESEAETDDVTEELKRLAATLFGAASDKGKRNKALSDLEGFLTKLSPKDYPDLADSPVVQQFIDTLGQRKAEINRDDPPGTVYNPGTLAATSKPWTEEDLRRSDIPLVEFEFQSFQDVIWNGIRRQYQPDVPYRDYRCFPDLVRESRRNLNMAEEHAQYLMRKRNVLTDPSMAGLGTARVRGTADSGTYTPGGGLFTPDYLTGATEGEEGEEGAE